MPGKAAAAAIVIGCAVLAGITVRAAECEERCHRTAYGRRGLLAAKMVAAAEKGARCRQMDARRQDLQARARLRSGHAAVRAACLRACASPAGRPAARSATTSWSINDEFVATEIGQTGTQFDGLGHIGIQLGKDGDKNEMHFYNGFTRPRSTTPRAEKARRRKLKPLFTRGHLFDIAGLKGGMMDAGQEITVADLRACLQRQNMQESDIKPGDAALFNTGWGSLWMKDNQRFNSGEPGIGLEVARWVIDKDLA